MAVAIDRLLATPRAGLDDLFQNSPAGQVPRGDGRGTAIVAPGSALSEPVAKLIRLLWWQGKVFDPDRAELRNKVTPWGVHSIRAKVYRGASWFDGGECIVLDYSRTSLVAHWIRDEIRQIGAGTYLGVVYWGKAKLINFTLEFPPS